MILPDDIDQKAIIIECKHKTNKRLKRRCKKSSRTNTRKTIQISCDKWGI